MLVEARAVDKAQTASIGDFRRPEAARERPLGVVTAKC
jgi:hypothetical protein